MDRLTHTCGTSLVPVTRTAIPMPEDGQWPKNVQDAAVLRCPQCARLARTDEVKGA